MFYIRTKGAIHQSSTGFKKKCIGVPVTYMSGQSN